MTFANGERGQKLSAGSWPAPPAASRVASAPPTSKRSRQALPGIAGGWLLVLLTIFEITQASFDPPPPGPPLVDGWDPGWLIAVIGLFVGVSAARGRTWASALAAAVTIPVGLELAGNLAQGMELRGWATWSAPMAAVVCLAIGVLCAVSVVFAVLRWFATDEPAPASREH